MKNIIALFLLIFFAFGTTDVLAVQNRALQDIQTEASKESLKDSVNNALAQYLPDAKLLDFYETKQNGKTVCICRVSYQNTIIDLTIDPKTGQVLGNIQGQDGGSPAGLNMAPNSAAIRVSTKQANEILKDILPGASVSRTGYDKKTGVINGNIQYQNFKFYFEMNAQTGEIIKMQPMSGF